jgi:WXG100 family type VII secretion target
MSARKIRADYEQLQNIAKQFSASAERCEQAVKKIEKAKNVLQGGDWVGKGATKFYGELDGSVLPSLNRMTAALKQAADHTQKMNRIMSEAEQTSAALFRLDASGGGGLRLGFALDGKTLGDAGENMGGRLNAKGEWVLPETRVGCIKIPRPENSITPNRAPRAVIANQTPARFQKAW